MSFHFFSSQLRLLSSALYRKSKQSVVWNLYLMFYCWHVELIVGRFLLVVPSRSDIWRTCGVYLLFKYFKYLFPVYFSAQITHFSFLMCICFETKQEKHWSVAAEREFMCSFYCFALNLLSLFDVFDVDGSQTSDLNVSVILSFIIKTSIFDSFLYNPVGFSTYCVFVWSVSVRPRRIWAELSEGFIVYLK